MKKIYGGDIRAFTGGGRFLTVAPECAIEMTPSGYDNEFKPSGGGEMVGTQKAVLGAIDGLEIIVKNDKADLEYITDWKNYGDAKPITIDLADGSTWQGSMGIEGELKYKSDTGAVGIALRGERLEQI